MPRPRLDWFKLKTGATRHPKVTQLSDREFRVWIELLDAASEQKVRGSFQSYAAAAAIIRRKPAEVRSLAKSGLLDEAEGGTVTMHDWDVWQKWRREGELDFTPVPPVNHSNKTPESLRNGSHNSPERLANHSNKTLESLSNRPRAREESESETETELKDAVAAAAAPVAREASSGFYRPNGSLPVRFPTAAAANLSDLPDEVTERLSRPPIGDSHADR